MSNALAEEISELSYEDRLDLLMFIVSSLKSKKKNVEENVAQRFLKLSMDDPRSAEEIIADMRNANQSVRFGESKVLFD